MQFQYKVLLLFVITIILSSFVSAWEWDNIKQYDASTETITIRNSFIELFPLGEVATVKLDTPRHNIVRPGNDVLFGKITINNKEMDYPAFFKEMEFYDLNQNGKTTILDFKVKFATEVTRYRNRTSAICPNPDVIKDCHEEITTLNEPYIDIEWKDLDTVKDLPQGVITIGLFTDVYEGQHIEWIPTLFGLRLTEWNDFTGASKIEWAYPTLNSARGVQNGEWVRQNFTIGYSSPNATYVMEGVTIGISQKNPSTCSAGETFNVTLYNAAYDTIIAQNGSIPCSVIISTNYNSPDFYNVTLSATLTSNTQYYIEVRKDGTNDLLMWVPNELGTNNYDGGNYAQNSGGAWTNYNEDAWFEVWGTDVSPPPDNNISVSLRSPPNAINMSNTTIDFEGNTSVRNINMTNATLYVWNSSGFLNYTNTTMTPAAVNISRDVNWTVGTFDDDTWMWNIYACASNISNTYCKFADSNRSLTIDSTPPTIVVNYPNGTYDYYVGGTNTTINWSYIELTPSVCKFYYSGVNKTVSCHLNTTELNITTPTNQELIFFMNDSLGNSASYRAIWDYDIFENNRTYNTSTYETQQEYYDFNFNYNNTKYTTMALTFYYNGTAKVTNPVITGLNNLYYSVNDIPLTTSQTNNSMLWSVTLNNTINRNSSIANQSILPIALAECDTIYTVLVANFTAWQESNSTVRVRPYNFYGTFAYWLGNGSTYKNLSVSNPLDNETDLCVSPNKSYHTNAVIEYGASGFVSRNYYFLNTEINESNPLHYLYLIPSGDETEFIIKVRDSTYDDVRQATVYYQRYYPGTNEWINVEVGRTNDDGETSGQFITTATYRFIIYDANAVKLYTTAPTKMICSTTPTCSITITIPGSAIYPAQSSLDSLTSSLVYSRTSNIFTYIYSDSNASAQGGRLKVVRTSIGNSSATVCNTVSNNIAATITCDISSELNGTYIAIGYINRTENENIVVRMITEYREYDAVSEIGVDGLLWSAFLILQLVMFGLYSPVLAIIFGLVGFISIYFLGFANIGIVSLVSVIIIGLVLVMDMRAK